MSASRALLAAGCAALLLSGVGLYVDGALPFAPAASSSLASGTLTPEPGLPDDGPRDSAARPRSGTGGPLTLLELTPPTTEPVPEPEPSAPAPEPSPEPAEPRPSGPTGLLGAIGDLLWNGDVETGDLSQFYDSPWNQEGSPDPRVVTDPVRDGRYAIAYTIPGGGSRNESLPQTEELNEGDDLYFGFSTLLGEGFPVDESWQVITQWKNDGTGSPPLSLTVEDGQYSIHGGYDHPDGLGDFRQPIGPARAGKWVDWVFHITFSASADRAQVTVWQDGRKAIDRFSPRTGTLYPDRASYVKIGYYRSTDISRDGTVYVDNWRVGRSGPRG